jgi:hypothetical protein
VARQNEAKVGILVASALAAGIGSLVLARKASPSSDEESDAGASVREA